MNFIFTDLIENEGIEMTNIVGVTLYIKDMSKYAIINEVYQSRLAQTNPPVRVCIECPLNVHIIIEALAYKELEKINEEKILKRHTMHVQSISHWSPANIGPYSQAVRVNFFLLLSFKNKGK